MKYNSQMLIIKTGLTVLLGYDMVKHKFQIVASLLRKKRKHTDNTNYYSKV